MENDSSAEISEKLTEQDLLALCGLSSTEQGVLFHLLEHRDTTAGLISRRTTMKRSTVYSALSNLEILGLVSKIRSNGNTKFRVKNPKMIPSILKSRAQAKYEQTNRAVELLEGRLADMLRANSDNLTKYEVSVGGLEISALDSVEQLYALMERALHFGEFCRFVNPEVALKSSVAQECVARYLKKEGEIKPIVKEIIVGGGERAEAYKRQITNPYHEIKEAPFGESIPFDVVMVSDSLIITEYDSFGEANTTVMKNPGMSAFVLQLFKRFWSSL